MQLGRAHGHVDHAVGSPDLLRPHVIGGGEVVGYLSTDLDREARRVDVREGNDALKKRLDEVIEKHQAELTAILTGSGVLLYAAREGGR